ncbi:MAG: preprotein translocase subunit SecE [Cyclobacteriaceae bacterium]|jgi:preprotein translocase subunit SecE|uniref:preprotein translocase subunit SecE n=1 Tax=Reichenbachiella sp. MALMAid0571 TaxID=3143939 RepID=UPI0032DF2341
MSKLVQYIKESYDEMVHKVTWSKYSDLQNSSILVLVASLIFALFIGLIDLGFENLLKWYYNNL